MKSRSSFNPILRILIFMSVLVLLTICVAIGLFYYIFSIPEPEGLSLASWPSTFTNNFSLWMEYEDGAISVEEIGLERLDEYGLWVQVIDEDGQEVFSYRKPDDFPESHTSVDLMSYDASVYENGYTIFVSSFENSGRTWGYIVGFPYAIGKNMVYYNGENVGRLSPILRIVIFFVFCIVTLFTVGYGFWLTRHLSKITNSIGHISLRAYDPLKEKGIFSNIYKALNEMDAKIRRSDKAMEDTERARIEWITNITHDLKTPLSPVKGYAEMLADGITSDCETVQEYGAIILKNVNHTERLINDLKLTYQLDSGAMPYHLEEVRLVRYLKELVIDIANDPAYSDRSIEFESNLQEITAHIDTDLFRRAVQNLVINALVHNPVDTEVKISITREPINSISIFIRDNGVGISDEAQAKLFNRYYRGTNTKESTEGTGLGLAIAKQIILLHGGDIIVNSSVGTGTEFAIKLPIRNR